MAEPLTGLTRDKVVWRWGDAETNSFKALKVAMAIAPILRLPDFDKQFVATTDASDVAVGPYWSRTSVLGYNLLHSQVGS